MINDEKLAIDETNRTEQHVETKAKIRREVQSDIVRQARPADDSDRNRTAIVAEQLKEKAVSEAARSESEIERARSAARASQVVDYIFYVIYSLIGLEILLDLLGARESNSFKGFIDLVTAPFLSPFRTLLPDLTSGRFQLRVSFLVALIVYVLLHLGINGLLRMLVQRKTAV
jgi:uncharacterized protein YggT (Ycf19 family)